jgi:hypothetical protein
MQRAEREDSHKYDREMQDRNRNLDRNANLNAPTLAKVPAVLGVQAFRPFRPFGPFTTSKSFELRLLTHLMHLRLGRRRMQMRLLRRVRDTKSLILAKF